MDRGNIYVAQHPTHDANEGIYIYTDRAGHNLPSLLQQALIKGKPCWGDESGLTRIIFQAVIDNDNGTSGYGLSTYLTDNERPILVVDSSRRMVGVADRKVAKLGSPKLLKEIPFEAYVQLDEAGLNNFRGN